MKQSTVFTLLSAVLVLVILSAIGFTGWFVWNSRQNISQTYASSSSAEHGIAPQQIKIPADWQWFLSHDKTVKFAYPKIWGTLHEQADLSAHPEYVKDSPAGYVQLTKSSDGVKPFFRAYASDFWYSWDFKSDNLNSAEDLAFPSSSTQSYDQPIKLGSAESVKPYFVEGPKDKKIFRVFGKGEENCGTRYYLFSEKTSIVNLTTFSCDRGGPFQLQSNELYTDQIETPLKTFYKYLPN